ncbi:hypothetical protein OG778_00120 [Streptomyces sp. NBC_00184]|uniref:hypothetical protein n=1 Tax=unclassified Streptomyces TaxID=2593676 RepID=UPI002E2D772B|nr:MULTISPECIES: hypothetical protein [unclassified Streptomyces]
MVLSLWQRGYGIFHHPATLSRARAEIVYGGAHGPHGQVFHRFGRPAPQTLLEAIGNPRQQAALERRWEERRARERDVRERQRQEAEREAQRPVCARCGTKFSDERWKATESTTWGSPTDSHPALCERCKRRALVADQLARTLHHRAERHDQQRDQDQDEGVAKPKPGRWLLRRRT